MYISVGYKYLRYNFLNYDSPKFMLLHALLTVKTAENCEFQTVGLSAEKNKF